jgi:hypothetical protein
MQVSNSDTDGDLSKQWVTNISRNLKNSLGQKYVKLKAKTTYRILSLSFS